MQKSNNNKRQQSKSKKAKNDNNNDGKANANAGSAVSNGAQLNESKIGRERERPLRERGC